MLSRYIQPYYSHVHVYISVLFFSIDTACLPLLFLVCMYIFFVDVCVCVWTSQCLHMFALSRHIRKYVCTRALFLFFVFASFCMYTCVYWLVFSRHSQTVCFSGNIPVVISLDSHTLFVIAGNRTTI